MCCCCTQRFCQGFVRREFRAVCIYQDISRIQLKGPSTLANESDILMAMAEIEPYSFEPMRDHSDSDEDLSKNPDEMRRGNTL